MSENKKIDELSLKLWLDNPATKVFFAALLKEQDDLEENQRCCDVGSPTSRIPVLEGLTQTIYRNGAIKSLEKIRMFKHLTHLTNFIGTHWMLEEVK